MSGYENGTSNICKSIYNRLTHLNKPTKVFYFHVLREHNGYANKLANQGARITQGVMSYANGHKKVKHVP